MGLRLVLGLKLIKQRKKKKGERERVNHVIKSGEGSSVLLISGLGFARTRG